jgi:hypothetical protein
VWVSQVDPAATGGANLWFVLATIVTTLGGVASGLLAQRRVRTVKREAAAALDEAVEEYKRMIADPLKRDRDRYQQLWQQCMQDRWRHDERRRSPDD